MNPDLETSGKRICTECVDLECEIAEHVTGADAQTRQLRTLVQRLAIVRETEISK